MTGETATVEKAIVFDEAARSAVEGVWDQIMTLAAEVVKSHEELGFTLISKKINPSLDDIVLSLRVIEVMLDALICKVPDDDHGLNRQWIDAKQQITWISLLANCTKSGDAETYHTTIDALKKQAIF